MPATQAFLSFNAGELTPYLRHRTDFDKQSSGAELMQNFIAMPFGGVRKRPGTRHAAALGGLPVRLETFQFNAEDSFALAFTGTTLTVFDQLGAPVQTLTPPPVPVDPLDEHPTEFLPAFGDPFLLQFAQVNDVVFITSQTVSPKRLTRGGDGHWTLEEIPFSYPPLLETNHDEDAVYTLSLAGSIPPWTAPFVGGVYPLDYAVDHAGKQWICILAHTPNNNPATGNEPGVGEYYARYWREAYVEKGQTGVISGPAFSVDHLGSYFEVSQKRELDQFETYVKLQNNTVTSPYSKPLVIRGKWSLITTGIWNGTVFVQKSSDNGKTWKDYQSYTSVLDHNFTDSGDEDARVMMRLRYAFADAGSGTVAPRATLTAEEPYLTALLKITRFPVPGFLTYAEFEAVDDVDLGPTDIWREGAFSRYQGYPAAVAVHERRLVFAGTRRHAVSVWTSKTDDLLNFTPGSTEADASLFITLAATRQDPVRWIASQRRLVIGTAGSEWVFGSDTSDAALSPSNLLVRQYTFFGSAALPALTMQAGVFFIERQGRRLRELAYQIDQESYDAADLTRLAEHITEGGLVQTAWQGNREPALWAVRADGTMVHFTYTRGSIPQTASFPRSSGERKSSAATSAALPSSTTTSATSSSAPPGPCKKSGAWRAGPPSASKRSPPPCSGSPARSAMTPRTWRARARRPTTPSTPACLVLAS
ncbi:MAG: hypothetical protein JWO82_1871 [Akkermansiaceae bacterium]|nr:hypothetical protein [Akkermansiaceae bacterium]